MKTLDEYLDLAGRAHGHLCAGQVLGVRMAMYGLGLLGVADPEAERKRLVTFVEIDRCATDAIQVVTGCRFGKRALKFRDFGKMAATFCDLREGRAVRIAARDSARLRARALLRSRERERTRDAGLPRASGQRAFPGARRTSACRAGGPAGLQGAACCLLAMRRGDKFPPRGGARWRHAMPRLRRRSVL